MYLKITEREEVDTYGMTQQLLFLALCAKVFVTFFLKIIFALLVIIETPVKHRYGLAPGAGSLLAPPLLRFWNYLSFMFIIFIGLHIDS